jgi:hypothetical protein
MMHPSTGTMVWFVTADFDAIRQASLFGRRSAPTGRPYLVLNPLQVLTAYDNGVENVVALFTDGILSAARGRRSARASTIELY